MIAFLELAKKVLFYNTEAPLLFNSFIFMFLFILVLSVYAVIYWKNMGRTLFLLAFSLFFYYKTSGAFVLLLVASLLAVYFLTKWMSRYEGARRKLFLASAVVVVLSILGYFKYANFFYENFCTLSGRDFHSLNIFLPVGISFYSFQLLSYVIDVYKKEIPHENNFWNYALYITFFPQLVAGPIVRAKNFLPQLRKPVNMQAEEIEKGFFLVMQGLFKKSIIADYLAQYNDLIFGNPGGYSGVETLFAMLGYCVQIYCDFSGYTDMAIGIGKIMGFDLGINFNKPYQAVSLSDFWRRWHISLSSWLRDYLYIPLGGNRKGKIRNYLNLMITMLLAGLWHGAAWKFVLWGGAHGLGLVLDKIWHRLTKNKTKDIAICRILGWALTLSFVTFLWILFRSDSLQSAWIFIMQLGHDYSWPLLIHFVKVRPLFVVLLCTAIAIHAIPSSKFPNLEQLYIRTPFIVKAVAFILLIQCILQLQSAEVQPFIYFQF